MFHLSCSILKLFMFHFFHFCGLYQSRFIELLVLDWLPATIDRRVMRIIAGGETSGFENASFTSSRSFGSSYPDKLIDVDSVSVNISSAILSRILMPVCSSTGDGRNFAICSICLRNSVASLLQWEL